MDEFVTVPGDDAEENSVVRFAHTYDGYRLHRGLESLADLTQRVHEIWQRTGELGDDVDVLRGCLFYEVRAHRHSGGYGRFSEQPFTIALVRRIRTLSGGSVPLRSTIA
ncbi:hypothetical protein [Actinoplanes sp. NPDC049802]|uniref:hypothetical protein n=1 Tax=Actinoplanes sp. NPDC049802 TaxID=3154742 RepID=UPI0033EB6D47